MPWLTTRNRTAPLAKSLGNAPFVQETESGSTSSVDVWTKKTAMEQFHGIKGDVVGTILTLKLRVTI